MSEAYELRASDADRDRIAELVRNAVAEGRLDFAELEDRLNRIYAAKTFADLVPATSGLPEAAEPGAGILPRPGPTEITATLGEQRLSGRWLVPPHMTLRALAGSLVLDFTDAGLPQQVTLDVQVAGGQLTLIVPDDIACEVADGPAVLGRRRNTSRATPTFGAPLIQVRGPVMLGELVIRPPRRRHWWSRRPRS